MIKELLATTMLAGAVGAGPLKAYNPSDLTDNGWQRVAGDGQKRYLQVLVNDGRVHPINNVSVDMNFDEACYYVANWWSNERVMNAQNYNENTRLLGFYYGDTIVFTEYVTRFCFPFYNVEMKNYKNNEQNSLKYAGYNTLSYSRYMFDLWPNNNYHINDDGEYIYGNFNDVIDVKDDLYYVRGDDIFFRTDVLCGVQLYESWDDSVGYVYHDNEWQVGYEAGLTNGYANGRVAGFDAGRIAGYNEAKTQYDTNDSGVFGLVTQSFTAISSFLNLHIAPNITLGMLLSIPIIVAIVFVVIKFVKG